MLALRDRGFTGSRMISEGEAKELRREISELREDLAALSSEVARLRRLVAGLRAESSSAPPTPPRGGYTESESAYSLLTESEPAAVPTAAPQLRDLRSPASPVLERQVANGGTISWHQRELICEEIGAWITRCVSAPSQRVVGEGQKPPCKSAVDCSARL